MRPSSSASSSRISAARMSHPDRSAKEVFRYSRKVSAASCSFLSIPSSPPASQRSSSPHAAMRLCRVRPHGPAASCSFLSISPPPRASKVSSSSPVAGFTVDIATAALLERSPPTSRKYIYPREPRVPRVDGPAAVQSGGLMERDLTKSIGPAEARSLLEERARAAGFDLVGVARAETLREGGERLRRWPEEGMDAALGPMQRAVGE